jgi:hypothetical protein
MRPVQSGSLMFEWTDEAWHCFALVENMPCEGAKSRCVANDPTGDVVATDRRMGWKSTESRKTWWLYANFFQRRSSDTKVERKMAPKRDNR